MSSDKPDTKTPPKTEGERQPPATPKSALPAIRTRSIRSPRGGEPARLLPLDPEGRTWLVPHVPPQGRAVDVFPGQSATMATGLAIEVPEGYVMHFGYSVSSGRPGEVHLSHCLTRPRGGGDLSREVLVRVTNSTQERVSFPAGQHVFVAWLTRGVAATVEEA